MDKNSSSFLEQLIVSEIESLYYINKRLNITEWLDNTSSIRLINKKIFRDDIIQSFSRIEYMIRTLFPDRNKHKMKDEIQVQFSNMIKNIFNIFYFITRLWDKQVNNRIIISIAPVMKFGIQLELEN